VRHPFRAAADRSRTVILFLRFAFSPLMATPLKHDFFRMVFKKKAGDQGRRHTEYIPLPGT